MLHDIFDIVSFIHPRAVQILLHDSTMQKKYMFIKERLRMRDLGLKQGTPYFMFGISSDIELYQGITPAMILMVMTNSKLNKMGLQTDVLEKLLQ